MLPEALSSFGSSPRVTSGRDAYGRFFERGFTEVKGSGLLARGGAGARAQIGREG